MLGRFTRRRSSALSRPNVGVFVSPPSPSASLPPFPLCSKIFLRTESSKGETRVDRACAFPFLLSSLTYHSPCPFTGYFYLPELLDQSHHLKTLDEPAIEQYVGARVELKEKVVRDARAIFVFESKKLDGELAEDNEAWRKRRGQINEKFIGLGYSEAEYVSPLPFVLLPFLNTPSAGTAVFTTSARSTRAVRL